MVESNLHGHGIKADIQLVFRHVLSGQMYKLPENSLGCNLSFKEGYSLICN